MSYENILVDGEGRVAVISLNRPEHMNTFTTAHAQERVGAFLNKRPPEWKEK